MGLIDKTIITFLVVLTLATVAKADCTVTLGVKKDGAKSAKLAGVSFSTKQLAALGSVCKINLERMSDEALVEDFKLSLAKKHLKESKADAEVTIK